MRRGAGGILMLAAGAVATLTACSPAAEAAPSGTGYIVSERGWWSDADSDEVETARPQVAVETAPAEFVAAVRAGLPEDSPVQALPDEALEEVGQDFCFLAVEVDDRPSLPEAVAGVSLSPGDDRVIADAARSVLCPSDD
ncbi:hypothetical protein AB1K56_08210 [Microbacterium sp. BWR-S6Y]|uniref:hypothetical protein n=1 Tax=Microbacterium sp. BWR-S6Y TaxID=3232073 RepID=UPI0035282842